MSLANVNQQSHELMQEEQALQVAIELSKMEQIGQIPKGNEKLQSNI